MLKRNVVNERRRDGTIDAILANATRQAQIVDDLLDAARILAAKLQLQPTLLNLEDTVRARNGDCARRGGRQGYRSHASGSRADRVAAGRRRPLDLVQREPIGVLFVDVALFRNAHVSQGDVDWLAPACD
jgi:hypothetical protein